MMKKLGVGLMRMPLLDPNDDANVDIEQVKQMVDLFLDAGQHKLHAGLQASDRRRDRSDSQSR